MLAMAHKYCPDTDETIKDHLIQSQQHVRLTQHARPQLACLTECSLTLPAPKQTDSLHLLELPLNKLFTDDTGHLPVRARSRHQYIMVVYHFNTNAIMVQPFASRHNSHRRSAYHTLM